MARLFFALWPDDQTRNKLYNVAEQFKEEELRLVKKANLHMTLEFLGEVSNKDQQELIGSINKIENESFKLQLTRVGFWKKPQILFIGTTQVPKSLLLLVKSIKKCVNQQDLKTDDREYKPHVTIARKVKKVILPKETFKINLQIRSFALVVSKSTNNCVEYNVINEWSLTI